MILIPATEKQILEKSACGRVWVTVHSPEIRLAASVTLLDAVELNWDFNGCFSTPTQVSAILTRLRDSIAVVENV